MIHFSMTAKSNHLGRVIPDAGFAPLLLPLPGNMLPFRNGRLMRQLVRRRRRRRQFVFTFLDADDAADDAAAAAAAIGLGAHSTQSGILRRFRRRRRRDETDGRLTVAAVPAGIALGGGRRHRTLRSRRMRLQRQRRESTLTRFRR